jgi:hypothetical protein
MEMSGVLPRVRGGVSNGVCGLEPPGTLGGGVEPAEGGGIPGMEGESGTTSESLCTERVPLIVSDPEEPIPASDSLSME